jgi:hypothetical protein
LKQSYFSYTQNSKPAEAETCGLHHIPQAKTSLPSVRWELCTDDVMTQLQATKVDLSHRVGLTHDAIYRLWKMAIKDDEKLLDEAVAHLYADIVSFDRVRAECVISLMFRHRESRDAFKALLNDLSKRRREGLDLRIA